MDARAARCLVICAAMALAWPAAAGQVPPADCQAAALQEHPLADRAAALSSFERMPESCLKALFVGCSDAASQGLLDLGSAAVCSIGYEALLKRGFGGDFHALMGWWRRERATTSLH